MKRLFTLLCCCIYIGISAETPRSIYTDEGVEINGVVWATRNVDMSGTFAENPESFGKFFQWNRNVAWSVSEPAINEPIPNWDISVSNYTVWEMKNNPCPIGWRVPYNTEFHTLLENTNVSRLWTSQNGVSGFRFTDRNTNNSVFFPAVGRRRYSDGARAQTSIQIGFYWSNFQTTFNTQNAGSFDFGSGNWGANMCSNNHRGGLSVRCVRMVVDSVAILQDSIERLHQQLSAYRTKNITLNQTIVEWFEITENLLDSIDWLHQLLTICENNNSTNIVGEHVGSPLQVYPNPVTNVLHITHVWQLGDVVELFDMNGRRVFAQPVGGGFARPKRHLLNCFHKSPTFHATTQSCPINRR